jgi:IS1 family transposase
VEKEVKSFGTTTSSLLALLEWLREWRVTHVTMESTGVVLETDLEYPRGAYGAAIGQCAPRLALRDNLKTLVSHVITPRLGRLRATSRYRTTLVGKDDAQKIESKYIRLRTHIKRLVCRTICFSKTERMV